MSRPISFEYLELACYGMSFSEIGKRYGVSEASIRPTVLGAARLVGRLGFWKFDVPNRDVLLLMRTELLDKMERHGLRATNARVAA